MDYLVIFAFLQKVRTVTLVFSCVNHKYPNNGCMQSGKVPTIRVIEGWDESPFRALSGSCQAKSVRQLSR